MRLDPSAAAIVAARGDAAQLENAGNLFDRQLPEFFSTGAVGYLPTGNGLAPRRVDVDRTAVWNSGVERGAEGWADMPEEAADPMFRGIVGHRAIAGENAQRRNALLLSPVGRFDVTRLPAWSELSAVPMETYFAAGAAPGDEAARTALRGHDLLPNANFGGFLGQAPAS
ncbi:hypothetical protein [Rhizomonospora bruguierae]|uniref:hypothetical protein n=1 Tax=Rhizomonospora bruguierae TaxID=1581705 RepID=UPI001BCDEC23|nr:hypothetical protein [Micromonospora sp. NBRC 107566]